ncbi:hypothetical protein F6R98_10465 [Candidatus Methylospira mobilis]|uniref:Uncharacterized protein n=1 Tax=Candidatus Methylospira mobilis TaxID=1808979 RepID=A0A5Q0BGK3_9GAMM|nr:hypothetical protein [Candidatus Methylospira mobilis]QFY42985.1 hypothetical protein F6R98_10465 [Candidatus Methylospira mobilis]
MTPIQATFVGYSSRPCTLFSAYNTHTGVLAISVEADYRKDRREGCVVITNDKTVDRDALFSDDHLHDAIAAFFLLQAGMASDNKSPRLVFSEKTQRVNPSNAIEKDGMDASGPRYRISESITCAQMAALATAWYASCRADSVEGALEMFDKVNALNDLLSGKIVSI